MTDIDLLEQRVDLVREDGVTLPGVHITPAFETAQAMGGAGVVIVAGEWGLTDDLLERVARPLARLGFFVVATDLVRGMRSDDAATARDRAVALDHEIAIADVEAALLNVKELARGKLGVIGFDVAAQIVVEAATVLPHMDAVVHAGGPPPGDVRLERVRAAILVHTTRHGEMTEAAYLVMHARMQRSKAVLIHHDYDAAESFFVRPQGEDEEFQARVAFDRTRDFLVQTLT